jgi:CRP-like cAMP-binding protein
MSGHLKVAVSSPEGGEKVIEILSPNQLFGVAELFGDSAYVSSVETVSPVVLVSVGRDGIFRAMDSEPRLMRRMLAAVAQRQSAIERDIAADCLQSGSAKVVEYLRRLGTGAVAKAARIELELAIPKNVLAARMGFTPETLSRIFRELSDAGFIHVLGKHVTLTEKFTRQYACGAERAVAERRPASRGSVWFDRPAAATTAHAAWN